MKALRMSEEEFAAARKRLGQTQHRTPPPAPNKNASPETHKFHAQQTDGYDSKREATRAHELELLERSGAISELREQVEFLLIDAQFDQKGELIEHACTYRADFVYREAGELVVEDVKGYLKGSVYALFKIKRKLMLARHGVRVREIKRGS